MLISILFQYILFEDGNGRIGRGIVEKSLSQNMGQPTLIALSSTIDDRKREYFEELAAQTTGNDLTNWLIYFGKTIISAQKQTIKQQKPLPQPLPNEQPWPLPPDG